MAPRGEEDNRRIREQQRKNIAAAAMRVFARKGFAAARISDIAAEARVSQGLVHHYYDSKDALFTELVREVMVAATEVPLRAAELPGRPVDRLRWYVEVVLSGVAQQPDSVMLTWQAQSGEAVPPEVRRLVRSQGLQALRRVAALVASAQATGEARRGDPESLAAHVIAFMQGLALHAVSGPATKNFPDAELVLAVLAPRR